MNVIALHGNIGSAADFDFLPESEAIDLWQYSHLSLVDAAQQIDHDTRSDMPRGVVGYSMGGRLALHLITNNPTGWEFAIIISAHPGLSSAAEREQRLEIDKQWADTVRSLDWNGFLQKWNDQPVFGNDHTVLSKQKALESRRLVIARAFENWSLGNQSNMSVRLSLYSKPLVWVVGDEDEKFKAIATSTAASYPNHKVEVISHCGHRLLEDASAEICKLVKGYRYC